MVSLKAREYISGDGTEIYCSDVEKGVRCPYTGEFISIMDVCLNCKNNYMEGSGVHYCIRTSTPKTETPP